MVEEEAEIVLDIIAKQRIANGSMDTKDAHFILERLKMSINREECESTRISKELYELVSEGQTRSTLIKLANIINEHTYQTPKKREITDAKKPKPMNDIQARAFEKDVMPWGKFKGTPISQVPCDDIAWLTDTNKFIEELKRYVNSKIFKERQKVES